MAPFSASASPVTGLNVLPPGAGFQVAGQVGEAGGDGVPLVETKATAQRIGASDAWRALLRGHLQIHPRRAGKGCGGEEEEALSQGHAHAQTHTHACTQHSQQSVPLLGGGRPEQLAGLRGMATLHREPVLSHSVYW